MGIIGQFFGTVICRPLGYILGLCYMVGHDYGIALILFTLITRVFLLPVAVKQQKSSAEMLRMKPKLDKIQKKYAKDKNKLNEETMKLYQEEGYNPMGGCLPLLIQLPIIWGLFTVVYRPLTYIVGLSSDQVSKVVSVLKTFMANTVDTNKQEIYAAQVMAAHKDLLSFLPSNTLYLNLNFFGFDLATQPKWELSWMLLIPIICYITSFLSSFLSMKLNPMANAQGGASAKSMNISMLIFMPLLSTWFCFQVPAGVGFYWICTNLFMILQVFILNKFYNPVRLAEEAEIKAQKRKELRYKKLGIKPVEENEDQEEETEELVKENEENKRAESLSKKSANKSAVNTKKPNVSKKKKNSHSKKAIKEQNRKKLSASRLKEKGNESK